MHTSKMHAVILPRGKLNLKLNRTGGPTHWRRKNSTRSIRPQKGTDLLQGYDGPTTSN